MKLYSLLMSLCIIASAPVWAAGPAAPTFQELMDPALFPEPQRGMEVISGTARGGDVEAVTTGAIFMVQAQSGDIVCRQRIGHEREVAVVHLGRPLEGARVTHSGPGFVRIVAENPQLVIRINGDSLLMLHTAGPLEAAIERKIPAGWHASYENNHLIADEWGAFGLYCSDITVKDGFDPYPATVATYPLPPDAVLWLGVCPPKPYPWERSFKDQVVWHWSNETGYPPDDALRAWKEYGNIVLLQSEVMLWKDWNLDFEPRHGSEEFARVRKTLHDQGMRFIVYTSPYYFLKGTPIEPAAFNSFENFKDWPPGWATGENMELFMAAITRVMTGHKPDGLYFDGQYIQNPAALYALARRTRSLIGEDGILEWHSTAALGSGHCYLPQADAYVDFILRGEGCANAYGDFEYLRYFVSGYNINNCIGVLCNNGPVGVNPELVRNVLRANGRFHVIASWLDKPELVKVLKDEYFPRLNPRLQSEVDAVMAERQDSVGARTAALLAEQEALREPPEWGEPVLSIEFDAMPEAETVVSPANPSALSIENGALTISAHGNTYAFLKLPLAATVRGFIVKVRQGTDGGQSWGPGAMLVWPNGGGIRAGTRSDGTLQSDVYGQQTHGGEYDTGKWVWLRARWLDRRGVIDRSDNGQDWQRLWTFEHGGAASGETASLLVGKVPYNGEAADYGEPGSEGQCEIDFVRVY
ncbi:MAG TPA: hypothetical protein PLM14_06015 [Candidatus Hydrogenedentes bacterium]|nr:hypothetical protein [Candidatus Hydrogenedentota bacterium]HQH52677.1 hypothetical protein [Candidatus Hydrogenedentota bacterium]